jgi:hypothetical protein
MIGAGLRIVPPYFLLFEKLINIVHRHFPTSTTLCFNSNPADTAEAVKRWVQAAGSAITETLLTPSASRSRRLRGSPHPRRPVGPLVAIASPSGFPSHGFGAIMAA